MLVSIFTFAWFTLDPEDGGYMFLRNVGSLSTTLCYNPEDRALHTKRHENIKSDL
jgi:hypothetical protein